MHLAFFFCVGQGIKAWAICKQGESRITAAEMKFWRRILICTHFDYKTNLDIMKGLHT